MSLKCGSDYRGHPARPAPNNKRNLAWPHRASAQQEPQWHPASNQAQARRTRRWTPQGSTCRCRRLTAALNARSDYKHRATLALLRRARAQQQLWRYPAGPAHNSNRNDTRQQIKRRPAALKAAASAAGRNQRRIQLIVAAASRRHFARSAYRFWR